MAMRKIDELFTCILIQKIRFGQYLQIQFARLQVMLKRGTQNFWRDCNMKWRENLVYNVSDLMAKKEFVRMV